MAAKTQSRGGVYQPESDVHISHDDQNKINTFAKYNAKLRELADELKIKQNQLKTLEEATEEIELFDEDEQIPYLVGEVFITYNLPKTQELLASAKQKKKDEIKDIEKKVSDLESLTTDLKGKLYQRFGNYIYLENDE